MSRRLVVLLCCILLSAVDSSRQRWYYTGRVSSEIDPSDWKETSFEEEPEKTNEEEISYFSGSVFSPYHLLTSVSRSYENGEKKFAWTGHWGKERNGRVRHGLYSGGLVIRPFQVSDHVQKPLERVLELASMKLLVEEELDKNTGEKTTREETFYLPFTVQDESFLTALICPDPTKTCFTTSSAATKGDDEYLEMVRLSGGALEVLENYSTYRHKMNVAGAERPLPSWDALQIVRSSSKTTNRRLQQTPQAAEAIGDDEEYGGMHMKNEEDDDDWVVNMYMDDYNGEDQLLWSMSAIGEESGKQLSDELRSHFPHSKDLQNVSFVSGDALDSALHAWEERDEAINEELPLLKQEIGLYDFDLKDMVMTKWRTVHFGWMMYAVFRTKSSGDASDDKHKGQEHLVIWTVDLRGRRSLVSHTWCDLESIVVVEQCSASEKYDSNKVPTAKSIDLRVVTYNLWNVSPPSWVFHDVTIRWSRYQARLRHFAQQVVKANPDILAVQEVRLDSSHTPPNQQPVPHYRTSAAKAGVKFLDSGSQTEHLLGHLRQAYIDAGLEEEGDKLQVFHQPSMAMIDHNSLGKRSEEGLLIISKYPIIDTRVLMLPREIGNPKDDHQRMLLLVKTDIQGICAIVATSHFSLKDTSRERAVSLIAHFIVTDTWARSCDIHILTGDLNAEPNERAIRALQAPFSTTESGFVDSWKASVERHHRYSDQGLTFPVNDPVKRIDYIFSRNSTAGKASIHPIDAHVIGAEPTSNTLKLVDSREDLGLNDVDSPLWASDHLGLVADFRLVKH